jgi:hypothetical protein
MANDKQYKRIVDNNMRWQGDIDEENRVIRVNKVKSKKKSTIIDTILHEEMHKDHPQMHEKTVYKKTKEQIATMLAERKQKFYNKYK